MVSHVRSDMKFQEEITMGNTYNYDIYAARRQAAQLSKLSPEQANELAEHAARYGLDLLQSAEREQFELYIYSQIIEDVIYHAGSRNINGMEPLDWVNECYQQFMESNWLRGFDPNKSSLNTYLSHKVRTFIMKKTGADSFHGRYMQENAWAYSKAVRDLAAELGREPSDRQVMARLGWKQRRLDNAKMAASGKSFVYLDEEIGSDNGSATTYGDIIPSNGESVEDAVCSKLMQEKLRAVLAANPGDRDISIAVRNDCGGVSLKTMADEMGVSTQYVSRLRKNGLAKLGTML